MIKVQQLKQSDPFEFKVTVVEKSGETNHEVTMAQATYLKLTNGEIEPNRCIQAAFEFLLDREPKEAILSRFDVTVISRYFPGFEKDLKKYIPL